MLGPTRHGRKTNSRFLPRATDELSEICAQNKHGTLCALTLFSPYGCAHIHLMRSSRLHSELDRAAPGRPPLAAPASLPKPTRSHMPFAAPRRAAALLSERQV